MERLTVKYCDGTCYDIATRKLVHIVPLEREPTDLSVKVIGGSGQVMQGEPKPSSGNAILDRALNTPHKDLPALALSSNASIPMASQLELFPQTFDTTTKYRLYLAERVAFVVNPYWVSYATDYLWSKGEYAKEAIRLPEYKGDAGLRHLQSLGCTILVPTKPLDPICAYQRKTNWPSRKPLEDIEISEY